MLFVQTGTVTAMPISPHSTKQHSVTLPLFNADAYGPIPLENQEEVGSINTCLYTYTRFYTQQPLTHTHTSFYTQQPLTHAFTDPLGQCDGGRADGLLQRSRGAAVLPTTGTVAAAGRPGAVVWEFVGSAKEILLGAIVVV